MNKPEKPCLPVFEACCMIAQSYPVATFPEAAVPYPQHPELVLAVPMN